MELTSNISSNHVVAIQELLSATPTRVVITSPYLASDMAALLDNFDFSSLKRIEIVTTFKANDPEQLTKPFQLHDIQTYFQTKYPSVKLKIHIDNQLHGKVYMAMGDEALSAVVTSANFTHSGMYSNHEWGLKVRDEHTINELLEQVLGSLDYPELTSTQINKAKMFAEQYLNSHPEWSKKPDVTVDIISTIYSAEVETDKEPLYFLKPIGTSEEPVRLEDRNDYSDLHQPLHFSKWKPKGVRQGDVVITTGVGCGSLISYFRVTGSLFHVTDDEITLEPWKERWPWYMEGRNYSTDFGRVWWQHDIKRNTALNEFRDTHPTIPVTSAGGFSLGTLNMGSDKVQITKEFAEFLIAKIDNAES
ncbi:phospholipase D family protein [Shewanella sp. MMG014]|uniref:phospholipase D-like domain-containing protein n=1 Tax=Shewanella sp. MMG014 TaxID=2822691 RepID=UPI001B371D47|nr:phospholipase D-like domain-containing protein [Shewanella sp. MMG014]MBQ4889297.1 phospholipase D family protein [Shewanella sp. MMG014]